jgi:cellulose synthase/poly-beta-1,6-N-acetylglucosamine synthase-like glycosyltransferase
MSTLISRSDVAELEGKLFVTLRPWRAPGEDCWHDPVDVAIARLIPADMSRADQVLPFQRVGSTVFVATVDPEGAAALSVTEFLEGKVVLCRVEEEDLIHAQDRVYGLLSGLPDLRLGAYLVASGRVTAAELAASLSQQKAEGTGARIGEILMQRGALTHWELAEAMAHQRNLPLIDLLHDNAAAALMCDPSIGPVWRLMDERFWFRHLTVPLAMDATSLTVAMADPDDREAIEAIAKASGRRIRVFVTGYRDVMAALDMRFHSEHEKQSRLSLLQRSPEDSAFKQLSRRQVIGLIVGAVVVIAGMIASPLIACTTLAALLTVFYAGASIFRLWAMVKAAKQDSEVVITKADMDTIPPTSLPEYTVLVPLYREAAVIPTLAAAIEALQYPKDRLDVKFLLEEDDLETIKAAREADLPGYVELLLVPASEPRTKPKACNYGLTKARGEYLVIFDAEDIPDPDQLLKAITVFRQTDSDKLACVQAKLSYYNEDQNILTRWFTAEYANWFELLLPSLFLLDMPIPLGGSSNHFRTEVLRSLGAWDPFNVTEDADLGVRLHKAGYRTAVMNSVTNEEANSDFVNWVRQRSRWIKGYFQTWLVHMRHPVKLWKELGTTGFWGFQLTIGGTAMQFAVNPLLWALTLGWFIFHPLFLQAVFAGWIYYIASLSLFLGNVAFTYANVVGVMKAGKWSLAKWAVLSPVYWVFMSIAAYKALSQLIFRPSYWEKTVHGLARAHAPLPGQSTVIKV